MTTSVELVFLPLKCLQHLESRLPGFQDGSWATRALPWPLHLQLWDMHGSWNVRSAAWHIFHQFPWKDGFQKGSLPPSPDLISPATSGLYLFIDLNPDWYPPLERPLQQATHSSSSLHRLHLSLKNGQNCVQGEGCLEATSPRKFWLGPSQPTFLFLHWTFLVWVSWKQSQANKNSEVR